jgi:hypothetical protein
MRSVIQRAVSVVRTGAVLYRELAVSALRLVPGRR